MSADPVRLFAVRLWRGIGPGREFTLPARQRGVSGCDPLLGAIDDFLESQVRGDSSRISLLVGNGFVHTILSEDGRTLTYRLAKSEPPIDTRSLVEREQAAIDAEVARQRARMARELEIAEKHARFLNGPSQAEQITQLVAQQIALQLPGAVRAALREQAALAPTGAE
jgi:hypothetical protein